MVDRDVVARRLLALHEAIGHLRASKAGDEASGRPAFQTLAMAGVLEASHAERLGNAVSMRNVLVHDYVAVDLAILARAVREDLVDLESFASVIGRML